MTYNRSEIMTAAWAIVRKANVEKFGFRIIMSRALRQAWANARHEAAMAAWDAQQTAMSDEERTLSAAINDLENKDHWSQADYARMDELRAAFADAAQHKADADTAVQLAEKRKLIESAKGRFAGVTFIKKDGSVRHMRVQPAKLKRHVKGQAASQAAQKAVQTRKSRHPNLLPVWDAEAAAPRSVNLATVSRIAVNGAVHEFQI